MYKTVNKLYIIKLDFYEKKLYSVKINSSMNRWIINYKYIHMKLEKSIKVKKYIS